MRARSAFFSLVLAIPACNAAAVDASYWDRPAAERGPDAVEDADADPDAGRDRLPSAPADAAVPGAEPADARTCFSLELTTSSYGGEYAPDNVGAIWISRGDGTFVRTLETWGNKRLRNAVAWRAASAGNVVDAITGATRQAHGTHSVVWTCQDAPGAYVAHVEFTEDDSAKGGRSGPRLEIPFDTSQPGPLSVAGDASYGAITAVVPGP